MLNLKDGLSACAALTLAFFLKKNISIQIPTVLDKCNEKWMQYAFNVRQDKPRDIF